MGVATSAAKVRSFKDSYRVVIGPAAWGQLGQLPRDAYIAVRTLLVAEAEAAPRTDRSEAEGERVLTRRKAGGYLAYLRLDDAMRTVTLVDVVRAGREDD